MSGQVERMMFLDERLQAGRPITIAEIASRFEVDERTVKRDVAFFREQLGAPIAYDRYSRSYVYRKPFIAFSYGNERLLMLYSLIRSLIDDQTQVPLVTAEIMDHLKNSFRATTSSSQAAFATSSLPAKAPTSTSSAQFAYR